MEGYSQNQQGSCLLPGHLVTKGMSMVKHGEDNQDSPRAKCLLFDGKSDAAEHLAGRGKRTSKQQGTGEASVGGTRRCHLWTESWTQVWVEEGLAMEKPKCILV